MFTFITTILTLFILNIFFGYLYSNYSKCRLKRKVKGKIILTFDDGPGERLEKKLLSTLKKHEINSTFFYLGANIDKNNKMAYKAILNGHNIGNHGYSHINYWKHPFGGLIDNIKGYKSIRRINRQADFFRPPYGKITLLNIIISILLKQTIILWTIDSGDTNEHLPIIENKLDKIIKEKGGVILLHSFDRGFDNEDRELYVIRFVESLIMISKNEGLKIVSLNSIVGNKK